MDWLAGLWSSGRSECVYRWIGWVGFGLVAGQSVYTDGLVGLAWLSSSSRSECVYRWIGWVGFVLVAGQSNIRGTFW